MAHECENCGMVCACDMEDHESSQPDDCWHFTIKGYCEAEDGDLGDYDDYDDTVLP